MSAIPNDAATAVPQNSLEDLIVQMEANYPKELRDARGQLPDGPATEALKADSDRMRRLSELAEVDLTQTAPGEPDRAIIADVAVRGPYVSFVVLDEAGVPSNGVFSLAALDEGASSSDSAGLIAGTQTPVGSTGAPGSIGHGTATVPTTARDGKPAAPLGVPADIDDRSDDDVIELLNHPEPGTDPRAIARYVKSQDSPSRAVIDEAFDLGLFAPNTSTVLGGPDAQSTHPVEGPGTGDGGGGGEGSSGDSPKPFDDVQGLTGDDLEKAASDAGIDTSQGGTLGNGGMRADEKRNALVAKRIDGLTGSDLTDAVNAYEINWREGGSNEGGSMSADEARAALKSKLGVG